MWSGFQYFNSLFERTYFYGLSKGPLKNSILL